MPDTPSTDAPLPEAGTPARALEKDARKVGPALQALLFSSARPVRSSDLAEILEATPEAVEEALGSLAASCEGAQSGIRLEEVAGGWRFVTRPEFDSLLRRFHEVSERSRLSLAALETLAIIAYRQPITLPEIQEVRGVNSASVLNTLFEKKLITTAGRKSVVGSPFLYRTTPDFLIRFGLRGVEDLPRPEEIDEDLGATVGEGPGPVEPDAARASAAPEDEELEDEGDDEDDEDQLNDDKDEN